MPPPDARTKSVPSGIAPALTHRDRIVILDMPARDLDAAASAPVHGPPA